MKRLVFAALAVAAVFTACEKPVINETGATDENGQPIEDVSQYVKKFTFTMKGDFSDKWKPVTRGYLQADGKDLTDVWVLDYQDGVLVQQLHQGDNTADDFGKPTMNLKYGLHHIYFIASRGSDPDLNVIKKTITWSKVLDTFYKDYEVNVVSSSNGNRAVTLDRVVSRLRLTITDAVAAGTDRIVITPATWYYGINYITGEPAGEKTDSDVALTISASDAGKTGLQVNLFGISSADEWQTDVTVSSRKVDDIFGSATLKDVPFRANRITEYSGPLFGTIGELEMSLNTTWDNSYQGTW